MLSELEKNNNEINELINDIMKLKEIKPEVFKIIFHFTKKMLEIKK